ncbi:hypothetical protein K1719_044441 [Acacia pycnantha]|nr:hypothetical protein K1719_044441 [Acacia pycnantha]
MFPPKRNSEYKITSLATDYKPSQIFHTTSPPRGSLGLAGELVNVLREANQIVPDDLLKFGMHIKKKESKLYGAHFKEISVDAPKSKKITFDDSDEDEMYWLFLFG